MGGRDTAQGTPSGHVAGKEPVVRGVGVTDTTKDPTTPIPPTLVSPSTETPPDPALTSLRVFTTRRNDPVPRPDSVPDRGG